MILEAEANLTAQNQITIPAAVRRVLDLRGGESRVGFQILPAEGRVLVFRAEPKESEHEDPSLKPFLSLLAKDLREKPERIEPFPSKLLKKASSLVKGVAVNLDAPLTGKD
jgi:bifunctional DNA-binding transcriptional regulator/antitoxin component of YhaV-PrlF toxin-antitoxin module